MEEAGTVLFYAKPVRSKLAATMSIVSGRDPKLIDKLSNSFTCRFCWDWFKPFPQPTENFMAEKSIEEKVKDIIVEQLGVNHEQVKHTASFIDDLGADSLDIVDLVM